MSSPAPSIHGERTNSRHSFSGNDAANWPRCKEARFRGSNKSRRQHDFAPGCCASQSKSPRNSGRTQYQPPPNFEAELFNDLLHKRNRHLLGVIEAELAKSEILVVPWGAAHMPEIAREIQKSGFHLTATEDRTVIRFRFPGTKPKTVRAVEADLRKE